MSKFTPGPWICKDISLTSGKNLIQNESGKLIGEVYSDVNVKLIAAAPEMYRMLKRMENVCDRYEDEYAEMNGLNVEIKKLLVQIDSD